MRAVLLACLGLCAALIAVPLAAADEAPFSLAVCPVLGTAGDRSREFTNVMGHDHTWSYFPNPVSRTESEHAHWRVHYFDTWKLVENLSMNQQYILSMRGTTPPQFQVGDKIATPDFGDETVTIHAGLKNFTVPIRRVCVEETVGLAFLEMLGLRLSITRMCEEDAKPTSACAVAARYLPLESEDEWPVFNATLRAQQVDESCDLVIGSNDAGPPGESQHVSFDATLEPDLLARSEWIEFVSLFFNRENAARTIFDGISQRYANTIALVETQFPLGSPADYAPITVAWVSTYDSTFTISSSAYKANVTLDAGGVIFAPEVESYSNVTLFLEALLAANVSAVVDETYAYNPEQYTFDSFLTAFSLTANDTDANPRFASLPFIANKQVWRYDGLISSTGALDWFENAIPNADALMADFAKLMAPLTPSPCADLQNHTDVWFRNVAAGQGVRIISSVCTFEEFALPTLPIEAAESGPTNDGAMVTTCPEYLMEPWTWIGSSSNGSNGARTAIIVIVVLLCVAITAFAAYKIIQRRRASAGYGSLNSARATSSLLGLNAPSYTTMVTDEQL